MISSRWGYDWFGAGASLFTVGVLGLVLRVRKCLFGGKLYGNFKFARARLHVSPPVIDYGGIVEVPVCFREFFGQFLNPGGVEGN